MLNFLTSKLLLFFAAEPTQTVVMHRGAEPSLLQSLALQLADKVTEPQFLHSTRASTVDLINRLQVT